MAMAMAMAGIRGQRETPSSQRSAVLGKPTLGFLGLLHICCLLFLLYEKDQITVLTVIDVLLWHASSCPRSWLTILFHSAPLLCFSELPLHHCRFPTSHKASSLSYIVVLVHSPFPASRGVVFSSFAVPSLSRHTNDIP